MATICVNDCWLQHKGTVEQFANRNHCRKLYQSRKQFGTHFCDRHEETNTIYLSNGISLIIKRDEVKDFCCNGCQTKFTTKAGIRKHLLELAQCFEAAKVNYNNVPGSVFSKEIPLTLPSNGERLKKGWFMQEKQRIVKKQQKSRRCLQ
ncbi:hypothetical protein FBU30_002286 [Linnemannia zychae]|nr:hypothetical protein FBU30_002286 [Linnemannia zychae]